MVGSEITAKIIGDTMKNLMKKKRFEDISVRNITEECGISRKTFYYHFKDKYDVVNWIFKTEVMDELINSTSLEEWHKGSLRLCQYVKDNEDFYKKAINIQGQNCFSQYLYKLTYTQIRILVNQVCDEKLLSKEDMKFMIDFYYYAFVGIFTEWIKDGMREKPENLVFRWKSIVDKSLTNFISNSSKFIKNE